MYIHHIDNSYIYPWKNLPKTNYSTDLSKKKLKSFFARSKMIYIDLMPQV